MRPPDLIYGQSERGTQNTHWFMLPVFALLFISMALLPVWCMYSRNPSQSLGIDGSLDIWKNPSETSQHPGVYIDVLKDGNESTEFVKKLRIQIDQYSTGAIDPPSNATRICLDRVVVNVIAIPKTIVWLFSDKASVKEVIFFDDHNRADGTSEMWCSSLDRDSAGNVRDDGSFNFLGYFPRELFVDDPIDLSGAERFYHYPYDGYSLKILTLTQFGFYQGSERILTTDLQPSVPRTRLHIENWEVRSASKVINSDDYYHILRQPQLSVDQGQGRAFITELSLVRPLQTRLLIPAFFIALILSTLVVMLLPGVDSAMQVSVAIVLALIGVRGLVVPDEAPGSLAINVIFTYLYMLVVAAMVISWIRHVRTKRIARSQ